MQLPKKLKHFNFFLDGDNFVGQVNEITLPQFMRKMEEYRGGGMYAPIKTDHGLEALSMEVTMGGLSFEFFGHFGLCQHDGITARFTGSFAGDDKCEALPMEIEITGRLSEMSLPTAKSGEDTEHKIKIEVSYIRILYNGSELCEIDIMNMVEKWQGKDRLEDHKRNIGA
ncbi:phage major tail tube protein [Ostreibacterium oceani]|uniref:Phage major tail tube protein n=1 Tax=Ostreibacterium oceani TaxID=2654998 RepID=A0A6N7F4U4_9GAMM|nr:phage major tail tube protein [Ostreibacterium oceani]MPV86906.1 phage major tail tube protein [Ostreibacterium oceani]